MVARVICDIDGCLVPPRGEMWDFPGLEQVAQLSGSGRIKLALCSGRPAAFQETLARMLMIDSYCICENGAVLMHPITKKQLVHPDISRDFLRERPGIMQRLQELVQGTSAIIEFGKEIQISVNPPDKNELPTLWDKVQKELQGAPVQLMNSGRSIEVVPPGMSKSAGLRLWAELEGVAIADVVSIGDGDNDLDILKTAGTAAAPANCSPNVRATVAYVSEKPMVQGVIDIIERVAQGTLVQR
ncbi:MAG TPA: HAD family phosphatase [Firmicutes bacterium]|jgi:HAD superfamily hydrolase (TIGR01484 family)|nr:HAD family phosphatase [Bacillota bacterium]